MSRFTHGLYRNIGEQLASYEAGELEHDDVVALFQDLLDTGFVWDLQGSYQRDLRDLVEAGEVSYR